MRTYFFRRCVETLVIMFLSSFPMYGLTKLGIIPENDAGYALSFCVGTLIFLVLSGIALKAYLVAVDDEKTYFIISGVMLVLQIIIIVAGLVFLTNQAYVMLFGYTRTFNKTIGVTREVSVLIVYFIYALEIAFFPLDRLRVRKKIKEIQKMGETEE